MGARVESEASVGWPGGDVAGPGWPRGVRGVTPPAGRPQACPCPDERFPPCSGCRAASATLPPSRPLLLLPLGGSAVAGDSRALRSPSSHGDSVGPWGSHRGERPACGLRLPVPQSRGHRRRRRGRLQLRAQSLHFQIGSEHELITYFGRFIDQSVRRPRRSLCGGRSPDLGTGAGPAHTSGPHVAVAFRDTQSDN